MGTTIRTQHSMYENLVSLRKKVTTLATQSEDEELLAEIVAMLSGVKRPCTYTTEEFASVLAEAEGDYRAGRFVTQEDLRSRYGL